MDTLTKGEDGKPMYIETDAQYGQNDAFYEANGKYNFTHTCNTWANNALKASGQKAPLWTPFDRGFLGVMNRGERCERCERVRG